MIRENICYTKTLLRAESIRDGVRSHGYQCEIEPTIHEGYKVDIIFRSKKEQENFHFVYKLLKQFS